MPLVSFDRSSSAPIWRSHHQKLRSTRMIGGSKSLSVVSPQVRSPDALDGLARMVFRLRSFTPLPVLVATVVLCWRQHIFPGPGGETVDAALDVVGVALGLTGSAVRFSTAGFEPALRGQSKRFSPAALRTRGLYQLLRHPRYLGNALITSGLLLIINRPLAYLLVGAAFVLEYGLIIRAEERALREKFPSDWARWAAGVPSFWPRWAALPQLASQPFDWRAAVRKEVNPLVAWGLTALALLSWEWWVRELLTASRWTTVQVIAGGLLGLLVANKVWRRVQHVP